MTRPALTALCVGIVTASVAFAARPCRAQAPHATLASAPNSGGAADMPMPDDMGAPLPGADQPASRAGSSLSVDLPIAVIVANPQGKAVLEQHLPGLCERPEYAMFKGMSLATLANMSRGRISPGQVTSIQADLMRVDASTAPTFHRYSLFTEGSRGVRLLSHAVYKRVLIVVGSL